MKSSQRLSTSKANRLNLPLDELNRMLADISWDCLTINPCFKSTAIPRTVRVTSAGGGVFPRWAGEFLW